MWQRTHWDTDGEKIPNEPKESKMSLVSFHFTIVDMDDSKS